MKKVTFILVLLLSTVGLFSQTATQSLRTVAYIDSPKVIWEALNSHESLTPHSTTIDAISGTPYVFENDIKSIVIVANDGKVFKIPNGNYNSFNDEIISNLGKDSVFVFSNKNIKYVKIDNQLIKRFINDKEIERYYFILSLGKKASLLKSYNTRIVEGSINPLTKQKISKDRFVTSIKYYISFDNKLVKEITLKRKNILRLLDNNEEVSSFVKNNNLGFSNEDHLVKIIDYYNTLF